jgi:hypothetical protein
MIWVVGLALLARPDDTYIRYAKFEKDLSTAEERIRAVDGSICKQWSELKPWEMYAEPVAPILNNQLMLPPPATVKLERTTLTK